MVDLCQFASKELQLIEDDAENGIAVLLLLQDHFAFLMLHHLSYNLIFCELAYRLFTRHMRLTHRHQD